jgi:phospholipid/cholesterol/gamma-HCH transport system substrate-binding protein
MEYRRSEVRAGAFLLLSFLVLAVMVFSVSDIQSLFKKKKEVKALFLASDGIEKNAQVRLSGIKIGKVTNIRVAPEHGGKVELTLSVLSDTVIREDTKAEIRSLGLVGGKYVELTGGSPHAPALKPGEMIIGEDSLKLEDLAKVALEVVGKLRHIAVNLDGIVGDPALAKSLKTTLSNLRDVSADIKTMTSSKKEVAEALKNLPSLLKKIDETADNLKAITEKSDKIVAENKKNIQEMIEHFRDVGKNIKDTTEEIKQEPWRLIRKP